MFTSSLSIDALKALAAGKDPVCGMDVDATQATGASTHAGKTYYFCSPDCKAKFDAAPDKYATS